MSGYVVVTGGTQGIGLSCVRSLHAEGYRVIFCSRSAEAGQILEQELAGSLFRTADLSTDEGISAFAQEVLEISGGTLAGLVNNAGTSARAAFGDTTFAQCDAVLGLNLRAPTMLTARLLPALRAGQGSVVMMSSIAGKTGEQGLALYTASKAGMIGLTQALALEVGPDVRVNAICPGQIETEMMRRTLEIPGRRDALVRRIPMSRMGRPEDVAEAATWLIGPKSTFVTGAILTVDGGETAGLLNSDT